MSLQSGIAPGVHQAPDAPASMPGNHRTRPMGQAGGRPTHVGDRQLEVTLPQRGVSGSTDASVGRGAGADTMAHEQVDTDAAEMAELEQLLQESLASDLGVQQVATPMPPAESGVQSGTPGPSSQTADVLESTRSLAGDLDVPQNATPMPPAESSSAAAPTSPTADALGFMPSEPDQRDAAGGSRSAISQTADVLETTPSEPDQLDAAVELSPHSDSHVGGSRSVSLPQAAVVLDLGTSEIDTLVPAATACYGDGAMHDLPLGGAASIPVAQGTEIGTMAIHDFGPPHTSTAAAPEAAMSLLQALPRLSGARQGWPGVRDLADTSPAALHFAAGRAREHVSHRPGGTQEPRDSCSNGEATQQDHQPELPCERMATTSAASWSRSNDEVAQGRLHEQAEDDLGCLPPEDLSRDGVDSHHNSPVCSILSPAASATPLEDHQEDPTAPPVYRSSNPDQCQRSHSLTRHESFPASSPVCDGDVVGGSLGTAEGAAPTGFVDDEICSVGELEGGWGESGAASEADVAVYLRSSLQGQHPHRSLAALPNPQSRGLAAPQLLLGVHSDVAADPYGVSLTVPSQQALPEGDAAFQPDESAQSSRSYSQRQLDVASPGHCVQVSHVS